MPFQSQGDLLGQLKKAFDDACERKAVGSHAGPRYEKTIAQLEDGVRKKDSDVRGELVDKTLDFIFLEAPSSPIPGPSNRRRPYSPPPRPSKPSHPSPPHLPQPPPSSSLKTLSFPIPGPSNSHPPYRYQPYPGPSNPRPHAPHHPHSLSPIAGPSHLRPPHLPQPPPPPSSSKTEQLKLLGDIQQALFNAVMKSVYIDGPTHDKIKSYADDIDEGIDRREEMKKLLATLTRTHRS